MPVSQSWTSATRRGAERCRRRPGPVTASGPPGRSLGRGRSTAPRRSAARAREPALRAGRRASAASVSTRRIASAIASGSYGSISSAASPTTSGSDETFDVITGVAARHRLERRQAEAFVERGEHEHRRQPIEGGQRLVRHESEEADVLVQLEPVDGAAQRRVLRDLVADDEQLDVLEAAAPDRWNASISRSRFLCGLMLPA